MRAKLFCLILIFSLPTLASGQDRYSYVPNPGLTPGSTAEVGKDDLCRSSYRNPYRHVPVPLKRQIFDRYRLRESAVGYNVDHLIPVGLGGSNSLKNLWPQPLSGEWNYQMKNRLEHRLHKLVCGGNLELKTAQQEIATDWVSAYKKYLSGPARRRRAPTHRRPGFSRT